MIKQIKSWLTYMSKLVDKMQEEGFEIVFEGDSDYHHITIVEAGGCRTMCMGPMGAEAETSISIANPEAPVFEYPGLMLTSLALGPLNSNILMLGLGGGFIPRLFQNYLPRQHLTVIELDSLVAELAEAYFFFQPGQNVNLVVSDGLEYIARQDFESYDQIWLDAFNGEYIPKHLATVEFLELCQMRLKPGGLLVQNLHQSRPVAYQQQIARTIKVFSKSPLILSGTRCANAISINQKEGGESLPTDMKSMVKKATNFGPQIGPYNLLHELPKLTKKSLKSS